MSSSVTTEKPLVSVICPIHNGVPWINRCFESVLSQTSINNISFEICVCNDASTDGTTNLLNEWKVIFENCGINLKLYTNESSSPGGVGYAKNRAVSISSGEYLCFQDIDDVMLPDRILKQYERAKKESPNIIVGCNFRRDPENSTLRYTKWANSLTNDQLTVQVFTSHGPTIIMPTWFCHRHVYDSVGGFFESRSGTPEDLVFFYKHLDIGGKLCKIDEELLVYTFHLEQMTFSIHEDTIWNLRLERLERVVLSNWSAFTIWNAGRQGRKFYNSLSPENREKVSNMCDVDKNKIGKKYIPFDTAERISGREIDIIHFKDARPPFVICIKIDLTEGAFEDNLKTLNLQEGIDYIMFS